MTEKDPYWLTDGQGTYAVVTGAAERDRFLPLGWTDADEPDPNRGGFVYAWRDGIAEPGPAPLAYFREVLTPTGWVAGPPPGGEHPFQPARQTAGEPPDDATVDEVKAWVGDDPDRARQALDAEQQRDKPRTTLVDALERVGQQDHSEPAAGGVEKE